MLDFETNQTLQDAFTLWLLVLKQGNIEVLLEFLFFANIFPWSPEEIVGWCPLRYFERN